jgi:ribosome biogenesis GTPase
MPLIATLSLIEELAMNLAELGWNEFFRQHFEQYENQGLIPMRVAREHRSIYHVYGEPGELIAEVSGRMRHEAHSRADFPAVGDWLVVDARVDEGKGIIQAILPRKTSFSRKAVLAGGPKYGEGKTDEHVLSANIDTVFLVSGLDLDFNVRRLERFLSAGWDSGAAPVVVLNKADVCDDVDEQVAKAQAVAFGIPVHPVSAAFGSGLEKLREYIGVGQTVALLGSSGVGKSTIINALIGEERMNTDGVRLDDSKGRHTTTHRELIFMPGGGVLIDTPGMRRIQMWGDEEGLKRTFEDVEELMTQCRFSDCSHNGEPGCAVAEALEDGTLDAKRYDSYLRLQREQQHLARRKSHKERRRADKEWQLRISKQQRQARNLKDQGYYDARDVEDS